MTINIFFLCKRNLFRETSKKAIVLNYNVINDVMMMRYIYPQKHILFQLKISIDNEDAVQWID